jgi:hypothetical protein
MKMSRFAGAGGVVAVANFRNPKDSRNGSASVAALERRNWRRLIIGFEAVNWCSFGAELGAVNQSENKGAQSEVLPLGFRDHVVDERLVSETEWAAQRVLNQRGAEGS